LYGTSLFALLVMILYVGAVEAQFHLGQYRSKAALISRIVDLQMVTTSGNNITGAMHILLTNTLSYGWRGYNNYIQKVSLMLVDQQARDSRALEAAYQVLGAPHLHLSFCILDA